MLPMTQQYYCKGCGELITFCWSIDTTKGDRENPDYYHFGCLYPGELDEKPSPEHRNS